MQAKQICPNCQIAMQPARYGMSAARDDNFIEMGCLIDEPAVIFGCPKCNCQLLSDGTLRNPAKD